MSAQQSHIYFTCGGLLYILSPADTEKQTQHLDIYINWLRENSEDLLGDLVYDIESVEDEKAREIMGKLLRLVNMYQSIQSVFLSKMIIQMRKHEVALDRELYELSSTMTEILDVHIMEAENLRKMK